MVSAEESDSFRVFDFKAEKIFKSFNRVISSINEVTNKDIAGFFDFSA
jgi:hypothetical protein